MLRALAYSDDPRLQSAGSATVRAGGEESTISVGSMNGLTLRASDESMDLESGDRAAVVHVTLANSNASTGSTFAIEAVRHGPWFEGQEIAGAGLEAGSSTLGTIGRTMTVRGRIPGYSAGIGGE